MSRFKLQYGPTGPGDKLIAKSFMAPFIPKSSLAVKDIPLLGVHEKFLKQ